MFVLFDVSSRDVCLVFIRTPGNCAGATRTCHVCTVYSAEFGNRALLDIPGFRDCVSANGDRQMVIVYVRVLRGRLGGYET